LAEMGKALGVVFCLSDHVYYFCLLHFTGQAMVCCPLLQEFFSFLFGFLLYFFNPLPSLANELW
jgi:hypothetical protein